jgi:hypothetical protein
MNFYLAAPSYRQRTSEEILSAVRQAILSLYSHTAETALSFSSNGNTPAFVFQETTGVYLWARVFPSVLTHAGLDCLEEEFLGFQYAVKRSKEMECRFKAFVFFPSLAKGISESFQRFSQEWHFFEYCFLDSGKEEGLALREYGNRHSSTVQIQEANLPGFLEADLQETHFFKRAFLSRDELSELIELSSDLNKTASSS